MLVYHIVLLICISLMVSEIYHIFMFTGQISSFVKSFLFKMFSHFSYCVFWLFLTNFRSSFWIQVLCMLAVLQIASPTLQLGFHSLTHAFWWTKKSLAQFTNFFLYGKCSLVYYLRNLCLPKVKKTFSWVFF